MWTVADIPDLAGTSAVVTGANSGLGFVVARELVRAGARVTLGCRSEQRGTDALQKVRAAAPDAAVSLQRLDLAELASVREAASAIEAAHPDGLDLLVCNAGIMAAPHRLTPDGFESQLATNHLGHFALSGLLADTLLRRPAPRVVPVSSVAHRMGRIDFEDLHGTASYHRWRRYGQSKLANLLFCFELDRRARAAGSDLLSVAAHPGYTATHLQTASPPPVDAFLGRVLNRLIAQDADMGALPILYAATHPDIPGGTYMGPDGRGEMRGHPRPVQAAARAHDRESARRLWEVSEELSGVAFELPVRSG